MCKKIFYAILLFFFCLGIVPNAHAEYTLVTADYTIINKFAEKIDEIAIEKGDTFKLWIIALVRQLAADVNTSERISALFLELADVVESSTIEVENTEIANNAETLRESEPTTEPAPSNWIENGTSTTDTTSYEMPDTVNLVIADFLYKHVNGNYAITAVDGDFLIRVKNVWSETVIVDGDKTSQWVLNMHGIDLPRVGTIAPWETVEILYNGYLLHGYDDRRVQHEGICFYDSPEWSPPLGTPVKCQLSYLKNYDVGYYDYKDFNTENSIIFTEDEKIVEYYESLGVADLFIDDIIFEYEPGNPRMWVDIQISNIGTSYTYNAQNNYADVVCHMDWTLASGEEIDQDFANSINLSLAPWDSRTLDGDVSFWFGDNELLGGSALTVSCQLDTQNRIKESNDENNNNSTTITIR